MSEKKEEHIKGKSPIVESFIEEYGFISHHLDSFDRFVDKGLKNIIKNNKYFENEAFSLEYLAIGVEKPTFIEGMGIEDKITPQECRLRDITYAGRIWADIEYSFGNQSAKRARVTLGRLPIMLRSKLCHLYGASKDEMFQMKECPLDPGGYFIINGTEKVILMQEQLSKNRIIIQKSNDVISCQVVSSTENSKSRAVFEWKNEVFYLKSNSFTEPINIILVLKGLGVETDLRITYLLTGDKTKYKEHLQPCFWEHLDITTQTEALIYMGKRWRRRRDFRSGEFLQERYPPDEEVYAYLVETFLGHIPMATYQAQPKGTYIGMIFQRTIDAMYDDRFIDDRDSYVNKKIETAGSMLYILFENAFIMYNERLLLEYKKLKGKLPSDPLRPFTMPYITLLVTTALSTGFWKIDRYNMSRDGVTQILSRFSYMSALGMMMRIQGQFAKLLKVAGPRSLHATHWGIICPADTPEGEACGLVKNIAFMARVSTEHNEEEIVEFCLTQAWVMEAEIISARDFMRPALIPVFVNGRYIGCTTRCQDLIRYFRKLRRERWNQENDCFISIYYNPIHNCVYIACDEGRLCRPYIIVKSGKSLLTEQHVKDVASKKLKFRDLLKMGIIEYLDTGELNDCLIALNPEDITNDHTHLELEHFTLFGVVSSLIPFLNHNQSPRNTYQCAMGKQAMGIIGLNVNKRIDGCQYQLHHPEKPIASTKGLKMTNFHSIPAGMNSIVAVMSYSGFDLEDAIVMNKGSIDRGFAQCSILRSEKEVFKKGESVIRPLPGDMNERKYQQLYGHLDESGIVSPGDKITEDQILMCKYVPTGNGDVELKTKKYRYPDPAIIEKVMMTTVQDTITCKIQFRETREPEIGDKFSSRHGQKGVVGRIVPEEDLPVSANGVRPDLIMNPHGFPSRMTVGKLIELISGKAACVSDYEADCTPFSEVPWDKITEHLVKAGYNYAGKDIFYHGQTGKPILANIYFGPVYYQKLKHMVRDKMHARGTGPINILTRQPLAGRSKKGGLRLGEMERDCLVAHGSSGLLMERFLLSSDATDVPICKSCKSIASQNWCRACETARHLSTVKMPYAAKVLFQELMGMGIEPLFGLEPVLKVMF
ncbi:POLR3B [Cordylochernes scorpioides]|uniref:DNA-directed RNA polymerase subunit beta n=1 Tax=Cordylochernes scorpioides TaxID=51811 RepID=A0ABY6KAQ0_9ARAC|nr:POLR3B [Cordylochernes scorpioides]